MSKQRLIITSVISIVLVSILLIGSTYSIFTSTEIDETANVYKTGVLEITYTLSESNVNLSNSSPMTDEEADGITPYRITVTNDGTVPYKFNVILENTTSSEENTIDSEYIMTKVGYLTSKKLSNCTNNIIKEDVILPAGESVDIDVRVWISNSVSNSEIGKSFYAKLSIDGLAVYNDNEDVDNSNLSLKYMKELFPYTKDDLDNYYESENYGSENSQFINSYFKKGVYSSYIKNASFVDYINITNAVEYWDVSELNDGSVIAWVENNVEEGYYNLYIGCKYKIYVESLNMFFFNVSGEDDLGMAALESISFDNLSTHLTTNMSSMFERCELLTGLELINFNTSSVTDMSFMFADCSSLTSLDLSSFDTSNVTDMSYMISNCSGLTSLDVSNFDTSQVTDMSAMFTYCEVLASLDVSNFDTSQVIDMSSMFYRCTSLTELDLSSFDTSNVTDMSYMISNCSDLTSLDVSNFDTSQVTNMRAMFYQCNNLLSLDLSNFDTSKVTNMWHMFYQCNNLLSLDVSNFDTSQVIDMSSMFYRCTSLTELDLSSFDTSKVTNMSNMFYECDSLVTTITIMNANASYYSRMFYDAATAEGAKITVDYTSATSTLVDKMIATKSSNSNVVKGSLVG